jgi:2-isopropylmalate synthase
LNDIQFEEIFAAFLELADAKKEVYNHDLYVIIEKYFAKHDQ